MQPLPTDEIAHLWRPGRHIGRAFTWAVLYRNGAIATEEQYGSLKLAPRDPYNPITMLAAVPVADPLDQSRQHRLYVPSGADPVVFWRGSRRANDGLPLGSVTVLGWRFLNGMGTYLWIADDGRVTVTDRDVLDLYQ